MRIYHVQSVGYPVYAVIHNLLLLAAFCNIDSIITFSVYCTVIYITLTEHKRLPLETIATAVQKILITLSIIITPIYSLLTSPLKKKT